VQQVVSADSGLGKRKAADDLEHVEIRLKILQCDKLQIEKKQMKKQFDIEAAAKYYEASEGCRELAYIRGILKDSYGAECPSTPTYIDNQAFIAMAKMPVFFEK